MKKLFSILHPVMILAGWSACSAGEWSGSLSFEGRYFNHTPLFTEQSQNNLSFSIQPEYHHEWDNRRYSITVTPFLRIDQHDSERTHHDLRELLFHKREQNWELRAGIGKVFWGVTESQHLVDVINQTDFVENPEGEDKLGQPMLNLTLIQKIGNIDLFVLPRFRERTFTGSDGRLRSIYPVALDQTVYQSDKKDQHVDYAARWFKTIGDWDIGLSHFYGTGRDPLFRIGTDSNANPVLIPYYQLIHQTGLDIQATKENWLWKFEGIHRTSAAERYSAITAGFEYTLVGIWNSKKDLGLIMEYLHDSRKDKATTPFEDDIMMGARLSFNDTQSTTLLAGLIFDRDSSERVYSLEASRRLTGHWKLNVEGKAFTNPPPTSQFYGMRRDSFIQVELEYYF